VIRRFSHLLAAAGFEGLLSVPFLVFLAWRDPGLYGSVIYGLAIAAITRRVVLLGLYHPLVRELAARGRLAMPQLFASAGVLRLGLLLVCLVGVMVFALSVPLPSTLGRVALLLTLGLGVEAVAETLLVDLRVRSQQAREARVRAGSTLVTYAYGFAAAGAGLGPEAVALYRLLGALVLLAGWTREVRGEWPRPSVFRPSWATARNLAGAGLTLGAVQVLGTLYNKSNIFFLERAGGASAVAVYGATWTLVDAISLLGSEQLLAAVVFPVLSVAWTRHRAGALCLVATQARWLLAFSLLAVFVLDQERATILGLLYPDSYADAVWMQRVLVWSIPLSLLGNLGASLMVAAGAAPALLGLAVATTAVNMALNSLLVGNLGLLGACLVIVLTKLTMTLGTGYYCQVRYRWLEWRGLPALALLTITALSVHALGGALLGHHVGVLLAVTSFVGALWKWGEGWLGPFDERAIHAQAGER